MLTNFQSTVEKYQEEFQIVRILGQGSYGQVALVRNKITKKQYALKFYSLRQLEKANKKYSLRRALKILDSLKSDKVIKLYGYAWDQEKFLMLLEVCKQGNFEDFLERYGNRLTQNIRKFYIIEMTEILYFLFEQQIAHRDIKPSNFVIDQECHLKLVDFDEAISFKSNLFNDQEDSQILQLKFNKSRKNSFQINQLKKVEHLRSRQATYVGTQCYMAPELPGGSSYTQSGDIWSLGCIIYQILTSRKYMLDQQGGISSKQNLLFNTKYDAQAKDLLEKILKKNPQDRISSKEILEHEYLKSFNEDKIKKQQTRQEIKKMLTRKTIFSRTSDLFQQISSSPFMQNFQIANKDEINILILKKEWYFFYPKMIQSGKHCFQILNCKTSQIEDVILFSEIEQIELIRGTICIRDYKHQYYFKHIKSQNTDSLFQLMVNLLKQ